MMIRAVMMHVLLTVLSCCCFAVALPATRPMQDFGVITDEDARFEFGLYYLAGEEEYLLFVTNNDTRLEKTTIHGESRSVKPASMEISRSGDADILRFNESVYVAVSGNVVEVKFGKSEPPQIEYIISVDGRISHFSKNDQGLRVFYKTDDGCFVAQYQYNTTSSTWELLKKEQALEGDCVHYRRGRVEIIWATITALSEDQHCFCYMERGESMMSCIIIEPFINDNNVRIDCNPP